MQHLAHLKNGCDLFPARINVLVNLRALNLLPRLPLLLRAHSKPHISLLDLIPRHLNIHQLLLLKFLFPPAHSASATEGY